MLGSRPNYSPHTPFRLLRAAHPGTMGPDEWAGLVLRCGDLGRWVWMPGEELVLEPEPRSPRDARRWVRDWLLGLGRDDVEGNIQLLVTEVVTNALLHACTPIRVTLRLEGDCVRVEVADGSTSEPVRRHHSSLATIGRGVALLDDLAQDWGWTVTSEGKTVWFLVGHDDETTSDDPSGSGQPRSLGTHPLIAGEVRKQDRHDLAGSVSRAVDGRENLDHRRESGLGRYAAGLAGEVVEVRLLGLPVRLLVASQEHHDALLREFRLMALAPDHGGHPVTSGLARLVEELGVRHAASRARRDGEIQAALDAGLLQIDQVFPTPVAAAQEMARLVVLLKEADRYCDYNLLLTLARPPLVRRFSDWYLGEILNQVDGRPPLPWTGPLTLPPAHT
jgi:anti-sigma regulatory factor (Ser/Thr protein kinase)